MLAASRPPGMVAKRVHKISNCLARATLTARDARAWWGRTNVLATVNGAPVYPPKTPAKTLLSVTSDDELTIASVQVSDGF